MSTFRYVGDPGRYYPDLGITPVPGKDVELETAPEDGRWVAFLPPRSDSPPVSSSSPTVPVTLTRDVPAETPLSRAGDTVTVKEG